MIKKFYLNKNGKIEFTPSELKILLDEIYEDGYASANSNTFKYETPTKKWWEIPYYSTIPTTITCKSGTYELITDNSTGGSTVSTATSVKNTASNLTTINPSIVDMATSSSEVF